VAISERQIVLAFFGFLGIDALVERTGRLRRIERRLDGLAGRAAGPASAGEVLRARSSFDRMDMIAAGARRSVVIIGVNLEGALACTTALVALARSGGSVRLLAMDPCGAAIAPSAVMSGVDPALRRGKIVQNLELLRKELAAQLDAAALARVSLLVTDQVLPLGAVGLDEGTRYGSLIIQHYLTATSADAAPLMWLHAQADEPWYGRYLAQCEACLAAAGPGTAPVPDTAAIESHAAAIGEFFDGQYAAHDRYWWRGGNRYSTSPADHTPFNAAWLAGAARRGPGRALDLGAGEGADAIRLAKLGWQVDAVEVSAVACEKAERFARAEGVTITIRNEPIETVSLPGARYDLVLMNGCLHYVPGKERVLRRVTRASAADAVHVAAVFSTATPVPAEHAVIPVYPDDEGGIIEQFYQRWHVQFRAWERDREEHSHPGFAPHAHSHVKLIAARTSSPAETKGR
jgi:SAM-dependent methyltransferase